MTELAIKPEVAERRAEVRAFMEEHVYPNEAALAREDESSDALIAELRAKAKAAGIWAPHLSPEAGGTGSGFIEYALLTRIGLGAARLRCRAPTRATARSHVRPTSRKERFLPYLSSTARSFFR
jgi:acyl-CoA dehydrogenase